MRSSKELAKRLRFELTPRPSSFRRLYFLLGLAACVAAAALWYAFDRAWPERQYLPGPVSPAHATFGARCSRCHTEAFAAVPDAACRDCHAPATHSEYEAEPAACRRCHVEHRGSGAIAGTSDQPCVACHADLHTRRPAPLIAAHVPDFASHPAFVPSREGFADRAALRFNHQLHLESTKIAPERKLACASCHVADADGMLMRPVLFEAHCRDCHRQAGLGPLGDIEALHAPPEKVDRDLGEQLLAEAVSDPQRLFGEADFFLPGRSRGPIDQSKSLADFEKKWLQLSEAQLYAPFDPTPPLEQHNRYCFLCHLEGDAKADGGAPAIRATAVPRRWLPAALFSHRAHGLIGCEQCHSSVARSRLTTDVNLPGKPVCEHCHAERTEESAGTACVLCHAYHRSAGQPSPTPGARRLSIDALTGGPANPP